MAQFSSRLPDCSNWSFQEIQAKEGERAAALEATEHSDALVESLRNALQEAIVRPNGVRLGREHLDTDWNHVRAVVQFHVGTNLFDWFFNARTGYRAHFRAHYKCGLRFNNRIVEAFLPILDAGFPEMVRVREIGTGFTDCGASKAPKSFLSSSLAPYVTKIWSCTKRIGPAGGIEVLPIGVGGEPKLLLQDEESWVAFYRHDEAAWLDVKGGFLGKTRPYQPKNPFKRARKLHDSGTA
jgi:hypothetical protein